MRLFRTDVACQGLPEGRKQNERHGEAVLRPCVRTVGNMKRGHDLDGPPPCASLAELKADP